MGKATSPKCASKSLENERSRVKSIRRLTRLSYLSVAFVIFSFLNAVSPASISGQRTPLKTSAGFHNEEDHGANCTVPGASSFPADLFTLEQRQQGAVAVHIIAIFYVFYAILIICDDYFVPSVESICRELEIPSDVAAATFMACSSSAPELFNNILGTFVTKSDVGVGSVMGSTVFNILCVASVCGITSRWALEKLKSPDGRLGIPLEWWPVTRDSFFYVISIAALGVVLIDRKVHWYEGLALVLLYALYIIVLWKNTYIKYYVENWLCWMRNLFFEPSLKRRSRITLMAARSRKFSERTPLLNGKSFAEEKVESSSGSSIELSLSTEELDGLLISKALLRSASHCIDEDDCSPWRLPRNQTWNSQLEWVISWPIRLIFSITIPDCRKYRFLSWYPLTLIVCVVWIGAFTYVVTWMMTLIGATFEIPDSVMGLTFLAAGTSIPEVFSSVIVARQGLGTMALSNSMGSNTFDVLFCLGLPWLIQTLILATQDIDYVQIQSNTLELSAMLMVAILIVFYTVLFANRFLLDVKVGIISLGLYVVFIVVSTLLEMNVFFTVNLPPCKE